MCTKYAQIRNAAGVLITQLVTISGLESWPDLLPALLQLLKSDNQDYIITSLSCLSKLMEDNIYELDSAKVNHPLNELIPLFLSFFQCPNEEIIYHSVNCMRFSIDAMPNALLVNMDNYIHVGLQNAIYAVGLSMVDESSKSRNPSNYL